jgi:hypothetical protein
MSSSSLAGLDMFNFSSYWRTIKNRISELQTLGFKISTYQQKLGVAHSNLIKKGRKDLANLLQDEINKVNDDLQKWWKVKGYIDKYLPEWIKADQPEAKVVNNLSVLPIAMGAAAIAALAYVVNTGMALVQDYAYKSKLTEAVIEQKMTSGQAAEILSVPPSEGAIAKVLSSVGTGLGVGIPVLALLAAGLYFTLGPGAALLRR